MNRDFNERLFYAKLRMCAKYLKILPIPEEIMATQQNRRDTTTENLTRPFYEYKTPDVFDKVVYLDDVPEDVTAGAQESADWLD